MYGAFHVTALYLFCLNSERIFFVIFITYACHNFIIAALPIMGMWPKCWQTERSSCTSRTNMGSNWTNPNSLIQNTWAQYSGRQPSPTLQKSPLHLNWRLRWRVGKQIGTETLTNKCPKIQDNVKHEHHALAGRVNHTTWCISLMVYLNPFKTTQIQVQCILS